MLSERMWQKYDYVTETVEMMVRIKCRRAFYKIFIVLYAFCEHNLQIFHLISSMNRVLFVHEYVVVIAKYQTGFRKLITTSGRENFGNFYINDDEAGLILKWS